MAKRIFINTENGQGCFYARDFHLMSCLSYFTTNDGNVTALFRLMGKKVIDSVKTNSDGSLRVGVRTEYITEII